ncbi:unnamed protein product [marine sediment metagenome]|uniref:Uncharacterized protein n=1 Tax=marine sediment metagenome TaxID=412755 RepID=X1HTU6_9ZZZZ
MGGLYTTYAYVDNRGERYDKQKKYHRDEKSCVAESYWDYVRKCWNIGEGT